MNITKLHVLYFSPTGGTEKIVRTVAGALAGHLGLEPKYINFTKPENRQTEYRFGPEDLLVMASPVYAGRLPNKLMPEYRAKIFGDRTPALPICVFGNRSCDEALRELVLLLEGNGFQTGAGRPAEEALAQMAECAASAAARLSGGTLPLLEMDRSEIGPYYTPLRADGTPAKFLKAKPLTRWEKCSHCGACARACPLGSIDRETMEAVGLCIKCQACVRRCTVHAKYFEDPDFLSHVAMLEENYTRRAENLLLI